MPGLPPTDHAGLASPREFQTLARGVAPGAVSDGDRLATAGKSHKRRGEPSPETTTLLVDYQEAMRAELRTLLADIRGRLPDPGLHLLDDAIERGDIAERVQPTLKERAPMWDLAIKIGRELGTSIDPGRAPGGDPPSTPSPRRRTSRIDYG